MPHVKAEFSVQVPHPGLSSSENKILFGLSSFQCFSPFLNFASKNHILNCPHHHPHPTCVMGKCNHRRNVAVCQITTSPGEGEGQMPPGCKFRMDQYVNITKLTKRIIKQGSCKTLMKSKMPAFIRFPSLHPSIGQTPTCDIQYYICFAGLWQDTSQWKPQAVLFKATCLQVRVSCPVYTTCLVLCQWCPCICIMVGLSWSILGGVHDSSALRIRFPSLRSKVKVEFCSGSENVAGCTFRSGASLFWLR